jgi:hypothetical protein
MPAKAGIHDLLFRIFVFAATFGRATHRFFHVL